MCSDYTVTDRLWEESKRSIKTVNMYGYMIYFCLYSSRSIFKRIPPATGNERNQRRKRKKLDRVEKIKGKKRQGATKKSHE